MNTNIFYIIQRIWKGRRTPLLVLSGFFVMFVWWIGPKLPYPLNNIVVRAFITSMVLAGVGGFLAWQRRKNAKDTEELIDAVAEPDDSEVLKKKFKSAVKTLKNSKGNKRKGLLELPWYIIIGPPGSGKTTLLRNAGLTFPLDGDEGARAIRGVGGTRDCDWWFANEAVLLDTAGRYTTQDSDQAADRKGWLAFLDLLKGRRKKRPINGILIAIGTDTLLSSSTEELRLHADTIRKRVLELYSRLNGNFPIYLMLTKTDLIAGFNEFFENLSASEREQVWGYTQQVIKTEDETANVEAIFDGEFEHLLKRLSGRVLERLRTEPDPDRRALIVGFPERLARAREQLRLLVSQGFMANNYQDSLLLRGLYLTSGTQEGTPIDRMMGGMARALGTEQSRARATHTTSRSYFIKDLLSKVAFPEQDLLGLGYQEAQRRRRLQLSAYAGIAGVASVALVLWTYAYFKEREYVASAADRLYEYSQSMPAYSDIEVAFERQARESVLRLDALREARNDIALADPKSPLIGLPGDDALLGSIDKAYYAQLQKSLAPLLQTSLRDRLRNRDGMVQEVRAFNEFEVNLLSTFVRSYASLKDPRRRLDSDAAKQDFIDAILFDLELRDSAFREALQDHVRAWVNQPRGIRSIAIDNETLAGAQTLLASGGDGLGAVRAAYDDWLFENLRETSGAGSLTPGIVDQVGLAAGDVFQRRSGNLLNESLPTIFTRPGFEAFLANDISEIIERVERDEWVYGEKSFTGSVALQAEARKILTDRYVSDYIRFWKDFLNDVTLQQVNRDVVLRKMSRRPSPLKALLRIVVSNTDLETGEVEQVSPSGINIAGIRIRNPEGPSRSVSDALPPRERVSESFRDLSRLFGTDEKPGEIDQIVTDIRTLANAAAADGVGTVGDVEGARSTLETVARDLQVAGIGFDLFFRELVGTADASRTQGVASRLEQKYRQEILPVCREKVSGRYPFSKAETREVGLRDMSDVFGPNGVMTRFIESDLDRFVDRSRGGWTWRSEVSGLVEGGNSIRQFQRADQISRAFFQQDGVEANFDVTPVRIGDDLERAVFILGDKSMEFYGQSIRTVRDFKWPDGDARLERYTKVVDQTILAPRGDWGLFRILDQAESKTVLPGGTSVVILIGKDGTEFTVRMDTDSIDNPFTTFPNWRNFRCPSQLW